MERLLYRLPSVMGDRREEEPLYHFSAHYIIWYKHLDDPSYCLCVFGYCSITYPLWYYYTAGYTTFLPFHGPNWHFFIMPVKNDGYFSSAFIMICVLCFIVSNLAYSDRLREIECRFISVVLYVSYQFLFAFLFVQMVWVSETQQKKNKGQPLNKWV